MIVMLVTSLCWWLYDGNWFERLVAESLFWRLLSLCNITYVGDFLNVLNRDLLNPIIIGHQHPESVTNVSNLSTHLVSNIRHQHRCNLIFHENPRTVHENEKWSQARCFYQKLSLELTFKFWILKYKNYLTEYLHGTDVIIIKTGNVNNYILITWCKFIAFQKWIGNGFFFR